MVDRNLIRSLEDDSITSVLDGLFDGDGDEIPDLEPSMSAGPEFDVNAIIDGRVVRMDDEAVLVDVGFKSEGTIPLNEWEEEEEPPKIGDTIKVLIEDLEDEFGSTDDPRAAQEGRHLHASVGARPVRVPRQGHPQAQVHHHRMFHHCMRLPFA